MLEGSDLPGIIPTNVIAPNSWQIFRGRFSNDSVMSHML